LVCAILDGKHVAVSLSKGGSEDGTLTFTKPQQAKRCRTPSRTCNIPRRRQRGLERGWNRNLLHAFPSKRGAAGRRPEFYQQVYFHRLGTADTDDTYSIGKDFPRIAEIVLQASHDGNTFLRP